MALSHITVNINDSEGFEDAIKDLLEDYAKEINDIIDEETKAIADESKKKISQIIRGKVNGRTYYRGFSVKKGEKYGGFIREYVLYHTAPHYRLTHLLEKGHATRNGGQTRAFTHFKDIETWLQTELPKRVIDRVKKLK